jgi:hypothetical protein
MIFFITLITILQSFTISLGVGSSTLAIVNFFAAIADGTIDETERRMMGIVYVVLRIAMVLILITSLTIIFFTYNETGFADISNFTIAQLITLSILYLNAILMTWRIMPSTFGPALQAGSWYTLGCLSALQILGATGFSLGNFLMGYVTWLILAVGIVNGVMAILKAKKN